jgi:hypothetical protein
MNVPGRYSGSRNHSHSLSLGTLNTNHRVTRRKSMTANNLASVAAVIQGIDDASLEALVSPSSTSQISKKSESVDKSDNNGANPRNRRASDGGFLSKPDGKRVSGELKCETCGKGYKHSSCLSKHLLVAPPNPFFRWSHRLAISGVPKKFKQKKKRAKFFKANFWKSENILLTNFLTGGNILLNGTILPSS